MCDEVSEVVGQVRQHRLDLQFRRMLGAQNSSSDTEGVVFTVCNFVSSLVRVRSKDRPITSWRGLLTLSALASFLSSLVWTTRGWRIQRERACERVVSRERGSRQVCRQTRLVMQGLRETAPPGPYFPFHRDETYPRTLCVNFKRLEVSLPGSTPVWRAVRLF